MEAKIWDLEVRLYTNGSRVHGCIMYLTASSGKQPTGMIVHCCWAYRAGHRKGSLISKSMLVFYWHDNHIYTCIYMCIYDYHFKEHYMHTRIADAYINSTK